LHSCLLSPAFAALPEWIGEAQSLRAGELQSMKWLTEYFSTRAMIVSQSELQWKLYVCEKQIDQSPAPRPTDINACFLNIQKSISRAVIGSWR
jgi:hypothetical protein